MPHLVLTLPGLYAFAALFLAVGVAFLISAGWMTALWPWDEGRVAHTFIGAVMAAIGSTMAYLAFGRHLAAAAGGSIALSVMFGGMALSLLVFARNESSPPLTHHIVSFILVAAPALVAIVESRRHDSGDRSLPPWLRTATAIFGGVLAAMGAALLLRFPGAFPVPIGPESAVLFGWVFVGFAANFAYVAWRGGRTDARALLIGSLVYDAILIAPYLALAGGVLLGHGLALTVHTAMVALTGVFALYVLFFSPAAKQP